jgi:hypothetical protein
MLQSPCRRNDASFRRAVVRWPFLLVDGAKLEGCLVISMENKASLFAISALHFDSEQRQRY